MTGKPAWRFLRPALLVGLPLVAVAVTAIVMLALPSRRPAPAVPAGSESATAPKTAEAPPAPPPRPAERSIKVPSPPPAPVSPPAVAPASPPAQPPPAAEPPPSNLPDKPTNTAEWISLPIDDLRRFAHAGELRAMEELARRLVSGIGVPQDSQSGAGWLLRAAEAGSPGAAFNVGVMYERGFVVERDSTKAVAWYQKAVDGNVAVAKHNLALLLRDGRGAPRDIPKAIELLQSAAHQGMSASMFSLGDIYERGDAGPKDAPTALAWFAVTVEFERQVHHGTETPLAKTAQQRVEALQRVLTPAELERAERLGQEEFHQILAALAPPKVEPLPPVPAAPEAVPAAPAPAPPPAPAPQTARPAASPDTDEAIGWPKTAIERVRVVQQALIDLQRLNGKADGVAGPATRAAIRDFEKSAGLRETGDVSRELYLALKALALHDTVARSPLPPPPKVEPPPPPPPIDLGKAEPPPPPPTSADIAKAAASLAPKVEPAAPPPRIDIGKPDPGPPPPTSADIAREMPKPPPPKPDPDAWPANPKDQVRAIQVLLGELKLMRAAPTGQVGPLTLAAIREYQRMAGLKETGEPTKELFESLKETRALIVPKPTAKPN